MGIHEYDEDRTGTICRHCGNIEEHHEMLMEILRREEPITTLQKSVDLIAQTVGLILLAIASGKVATTPELQGAAAHVTPELLEKLGVKKKETSGIVLAHPLVQGS